MRLHLRIHASNVKIPFEHQHLLVGTVNKWLGTNEEHGKVSLFSFSRLKGGTLSGKSLLFKDGASMFFSAYSPELIKSLVDGIMKDTAMFNGLTVKDVTIQPDPDMSKIKYLKVASPILLKKHEESGNIKHVLYTDPDATELLRGTLETKMKIAGLSDDTLDISFDTNYPNAKPRCIIYKGIGNKASLCPVLINAKPETIAFAWNVGLGVSTGIGFGAVE